MRAQVKNLSAMTHKPSINTVKVIIRQNKIPFQCFSKRIIPGI